MNWLVRFARNATSQFMINGSAEYSVVDLVFRRTVMVMFFSSLPWPAGFVLRCAADGADL